MNQNPAWLDNPAGAAAYIVVEVAVVAAMCALVWYLRKHRGPNHPDTKTARFVVMGTRTYFPPRTQAVMLVVVLALLPLAILLFEHVLLPLAGLYDSAAR
jgi:hypothetical protein